MPALQLFGHRTAVAGDDLRFSSFFALLFRLLQIAVLIPLLVLLQRVEPIDECQNESKLVRHGRQIMILYWTFAMILALVAILLELLICQTSSRGTPTQVEKRRRLGPLCCFKIIPFSIFRLATFALGIIVVTILRDYCECTNNDIPTNRKLRDIQCPNENGVLTLMAILFWSHFVEVIVSGVLYLYFVCKVIHPRARRLTPSVSSESIWKGVCRCCCACTSIITCCTLGGHEAVLSDFADVAIALSDFLDGGDALDVTVTDMTAALLMVYREQKQRRDEGQSRLLQQQKRQRQQQTEDKEDEEKQEESEVEKEEEDDDGGGGGDEEAALEGRKKRRGKRGSVVGLFLRHDTHNMFFEATEQQLLSDKNPKDRQVIAEGAHFIHLAMGIYGYIMYTINHPCQGACCLAADSLLCRRSCCSPNVVGDNPCGCHEIAFMRETGLDPDCLAYVSFDVGVVKTPYCIVIDRDWKRIAIAVRGTLSLEDAVADLTIHPVSLEACGERCGFDGRGIFAHSGMLACSEWIYQDLEKQGILEKLLLGNECQYPDHKVVVCGHSLGAGCAAILAVMLRSKYPDLRCLCYEPPGCVLSSSVESQDYITSFVFGSDIVPRLSLHSLEHLRNDVLQMVARIKVPKHEVLTTYYVKHLKKDMEVSNGELIHRVESIPASTFADQLEEFQEYQRQKKTERGVESVQLFPPGRLVHFVSTYNQSTSGYFFDRSFESSDTHVAVWATRNSIAEIELSSSFLSDHAPTGVCAELERLAASYGLTPPYLFDKED